MKNVEKYTRGFYLPPAKCNSWTKKTYIDKAPVWCSVDLRDGNQALVTPMSLEEKLRFFELLVKIGFKEIEIGFPAASETEYEFCRRLINDNLIPDDVTIQVLTQSREHIIKKTFEAIDGCKNVIVHLYNSTSVAQREQVFHKSKNEIIKIATDGAKLICDYRKKSEGNIRFEYSPESFTATEMDYALEICNAVINVIKPDKNNKLIINLPVTVENSMPHIYASQVEFMCRNLNRRKNVIVSLHPHNDRGCAVADTEMGLVAGAERVEGTLFGNGERTGNVDIVTLALNMYTQGIDPQLDFSDLPSLIDLYEDVTQMKISERQPYSGALVFAAFSGSHQDAIAKGMKYRENKGGVWNVPYLPIDPKDIGREYDGDVIRINSQSGKGGIGYILEKNFGLDIPKEMREYFGYYIKDISDNRHKELTPSEVYDIFMNDFVNRKEKISIAKSRYVQMGDNVEGHIDITYLDNTKKFTAYGNGRFDACTNAVRKASEIDFTVLSYNEHALEKSSRSEAIAYVCIETPDRKVFWGAGIHTDIITASINALISALNRAIK